MLREKKAQSTFCSYRTDETQIIFFANKLVRSKHNHVWSSESPQLSAKTDFCQNFKADI